MTQSLPRVTALVRLYNNAAFAGAAIASALAQDYPHLQVLVADDASQDNSAAIARQLLDAYRGPHSVRLLQQHKNLGCGGNLEAAALQAEGDILVLFDGDDISLPNRVSQLVPLFKSDVFLVAHEAVAIGPQGERLVTPQLARPAFSLAAAINDGYAAAGAVSAYRRALFVGFAPLSPLRHEEDRLLTIRALLRGRALLLPDRLVQRRSHASNVSGPAAALATAQANKAWWRRHLGEKFAVIDAIVQDVRQQAPDDSAAFLENLRRQRRRLRLLRAAGRLGPRVAVRALFALRATGLAWRPTLRLLLPQVAPHLARWLLARQSVRRASLIERH